VALYLLVLLAGHKNVFMKSFSNLVLILFGSERLLLKLSLCQERLKSLEVLTFLSSYSIELRHD